MVCTMFYIFNQLYFLLNYRIN
uniref:Uncharacterized protein n=1 Tax=Lepeophtheirus salmonis TaxID=72036 RepID=A0A0K2V836_LEPSM